jgi:hypothetical protein
MLILAPHPPFSLHLFMPLSSYVQMLELHVLFTKAHELFFHGVQNNYKKGFVSTIQVCITFFMKI